MILLGVTGSIGMGKTTVCAMLETLGVPTHDADAAVHVLLAPGGEAVDAVRTEFPVSGIYKGGGIDRAALGEIVFKDDQARLRLENILHPLVRADQEAFIRHHKNAGVGLVALDIPLLFETGAESWLDYTLTATAPGFIQRARALSRPAMDARKFHAILDKQMPDSQKRALSDFIIHTSLGRAHTMRSLKKILHRIKATEKTKEEK